MLLLKKKVDISNWFKSCGRKIVHRKKYTNTYIGIYNILIIFIDSVIVWIVFYNMVCPWKS